MQVQQTSVLPVICIETAVERVVIRQMNQLRDQQKSVDLLVTVTNDGWFDDSSVIDHHLRCGQLVAVASRCPMLSAANNGPTAWIDSNGRIVEQIDTGGAGAIIACHNRIQEKVCTSGSGPGRLGFVCSRVCTA